MSGKIILSIILVFLFSGFYGGRPNTRNCNYPNSARGSSAQDESYPFELLRYFEGNWSQVYKYWIYPGAEPFEESGNTENKIIMDKFLQMVSVSHQIIGGSVYTLQVIGYDSKLKQYFICDMDESGSNIITAQGKYDESKDMFVLKGNENLAKGQKRYFEYLTKLISKDEYVCELYYTLPFGEKFKTMEIRNIRNK